MAEPTAEAPVLDSGAGEVPPPEQSSDENRPDDEVLKADTGTEESAEELEYDPEEDQRLHDQRQRGRRNFSWPHAVDRSRSVEGSTGPFTVGDHSPAAGIVNGYVIGSLNIGLGRLQHLVQEVSRVHLDTTATAFAQESRPGQPTTLEQLTALLSTENLVVLAGPPGSGRTTAAIRGLHATLPPERRIATFSLSGDPNQLREMNLGAGNGYVVNLGSGATHLPLDDVVADVGGYLEQRNSKVVIVVDRTRLPAGARGYPRVLHTMPEARQVLRTLLTAVYGVADDEVRALPDSVITDIRNPTMAGLVEVAAAVAAALADEVAPHTYLRQVVRQDVARRFARPMEPAREDHRQAADTPRIEDVSPRLERIREHRRCFMLSAALFNGLPLPAVTAAAISLAEILEPETAESVPGPEFSDFFDQPLDPVLEWLNADLVPAAVITEPSRLEFRNPAFPDVALEYVWNSYYLANEAIADWLDQLVRVHREGRRFPLELRLRAAQAVGRLAAYDFARVMDTMFKRWITAGTASALRAISWAVELMIDDPRTAQAVWERTRIWSTMSLPWQRAALVVYGDHLQPQQTTEALELVRRVAARSSNLDYTAVSVLPRAMKVGAGDAVFDLLKEWLNQINRNQQRPPRQLPDDVVGTTALAVHAARAFVLLATGTRKQLVRAANADPVVAEMLASLCRLAITIPAVATRGTTVLSWWLRDSQSDDDLAIACKRLLDALSRDPSTRRRLRYYAARWITGWAGAYPIAEDLVRSTLAKQTGHDERTR